MNVIKILFFLTLNVVVGLGLFPQCLRSWDVLVIHSYHADFDWVQGINSALEPQLRSAAVPYRIFYMDTKRNPDSAWKLKAAQKARELIDEYAPHVVIAIDEIAQAYVARNYINSGPIQFVFAGVNADPEFYDYPAGNVTGILERTYPAQVLDLLKRILPSAKNTVWISDDSATANVVLKRVRQKALSNQLPLAITAFSQPATFEQWKATIGKYDADPSVDGLLIPLYHTVKIHIGGQSVQPAEVMKWTVAHTRKPVFGFWPFSTNDGAIGAVVVDPKEHGRAAALMARKILAGKKAGDLPLVVNKNGSVIINLSTAAKLGIEVPFELILSADRIIE